MHFKFCYFSKLILSTSNTGGLFLTCELMLNTYSPIMPRKSNCNPPKNNTTTIKVGIPMAGRTGLIKKIKNITKAAINAIKDKITPMSIIILAGILVVEIKPFSP
jgi:hypothetical protein